MRCVGGIFLLRELVGAKPLHLATQDRSVAQKPHWGFHCSAALRKRELAAWQAEQAHISGKEKQEVPAGERPVLLIVCGFFRVRPIQGRTLFLFYLNLPADYSSGESSASTRSIR